MAIVEETKDGFNVFCDCGLLHKVRDTGEDLTIESIMTVKKNPETPPVKPIENIEPVKLKRLFSHKKDEEK